MRKLMIFVGMLSIGYINAQTGNVGINNETPRATLDVGVLNANKTGTSNQGVLIPNLSKSRVASITTPVESTLVYINDITYSGNNAKVEDVTEKGFYYYNGTKWVRTQGPQGPRGATGAQGGIGLIVDGTNTTVTGAGTTANPYKINATNTTYTGSTSVILSGTSFQRAALIGDVTAPANSNTLTIANNAVTSAKIANGTILAEDLNQMGATNGQVLKWNGTAWAPATESNTTYTAGQAINITSNKISVKTPVKTVTAAYTLTEADDNGYVYVNSASAVNVTIPSSLPAGFSCIVIQQGAGQVTIVGSGVTLQTARGMKTRTQYSAVGVIKRTTTEATITGDAI